MEWILILTEYTKADNFLISVGVDEIKANAEIESLGCSLKTHFN